MKINIKKIMPLFILSIVGILMFTNIVGACTATNSITGAVTFANCTVDGLAGNSLATNGISVFTNTLSWMQAPGGGTANAEFLFYIAIYASIVFFFLVQDKSFARFNTAAFAGLIIAIVMEMFGILSNNVVIYAGSILALSILASFFFHSNR